MGHWEEVKNNSQISTVGNWYYQFRQRLLGEDFLKTGKMKRFIPDF